MSVDYPEHVQTPIAKAAAEASEAAHLLVLTRDNDDSYGRMADAAVALRLALDYLDEARRAKARWEASQTEAGGESR